jgi:hypothetical protein
MLCVFSDTGKALNRAQRLSNPRMAKALARQKSSSKLVMYGAETHILAETGGFEPPVRFAPYDGLANRWFQPLTHVSALVAQRAIASIYRGINHRILTPNSAF